MVRTPLDTTTETTEGHHLVNITRNSNDTPTLQTWSGPSWKIEVDHGRTVDGYTHGHRRIIEALNLELGSLDHAKQRTLGVHRLQATTTRLKVDEDGICRVLPRYYYTAPRSGAVLKIEAGRKMTGFERARLLCRVLRHDVVHPRTLRSRGVDVFDCEEWMS